MNLSQIKIQYDAIGIVAGNIAAIQADIISLGPIPPLPVDAVTGTDYDDAVTAQATWRAAYAALLVTLEEEIATELQLELQLQQDSDDNGLYFPKGQWVFVTDLISWGVNTEQYISWPLLQRQAAGSYPLQATNSVLVAPLNPYPSLT